MFISYNVYNKFQTVYCTVVGATNTSNSLLYGRRGDQIDLQSCHHLKNVMLVVYLFGFRAERYLFEL